MKDFLVVVGGFIAGISFLAFFIGIILLFFKKRQNLGLKMIIISVISFVIGFSTCANNFNLRIQ